MKSASQIRRAFIVGHPVSHSRSPLIHGYWLETLKIGGSYERIDKTTADFPSFLKNLRSEGFVGGNITIPHKEAAYALVDRKTEQAERLKAVNTLWFENGELWGDNTDITGFITHLDATFGRNWEKSVSQALVLGAGGAARAILAGLLDKGIKRILLTNRTWDRAQELAKFDLEKITPLPWNQREEILSECDLVVNTTSLGMKNEHPLDLDLSRMPATGAVADIVYVPLKTRLLENAERAQLKTADGLGMLLHQAAPGFERWFGIRPDVTLELRVLIEADIRAKT